MPTTHYWKGAPAPLTKGGGGDTILALGPVGLWYADQYDAATASVPNEVARGSVALSQNIFRAPRRLFANAAFWGGATCVDDAATDPDGGTEASTVLIAGGGLLRGISAAYSAPAGDYMLKAKVKRNGGSDQQFAFTKDNLTTRSTPETATASWQTFTYPFSIAAPTPVNRIGICSIDGSTVADLQVIDLQLFAGSTDLGDEVFGGHLNLGINRYDTRPSYASGEINLSTGGYGIIQMAADVTIDSGLTAIILARKVASGSAYQAGLSKVQSYGAFSAMLELGGKAANYKATSQANTNLWPTLNDGYHAIGHRHDGTNIDVILDDVRLFRSAAALSTFALRDLFSGIVNVYALNSGYKVHAIALFDRSLSDVEYLSLYAVLVARGAEAGL